MGQRPSPADAALIVVDWGTSRLRARLVDADGTELAEAASASGIGQVAGQHERVFERLVDEWPPVPAIMAGMVGSRQGWHEVPYLTCPATTEEVTRNIVQLRTARGRPVAIVPGLMVRSEERDGDVMRGEETQIIGFVAHKPGFAGVCVMPGTHSKWVSLENGNITSFHTFLTGELFDLLANHSFLRHSVADDGSDLAEAADFALAVRRTAEQGQPFLSLVFSVRTRYLLNGVRREDNLAYLSGLLIGAEIAAARADPLIAGRPFTIIGTRSLTRAYAKAFEIVGQRVDTIDGDAMALAGLIRLARHIGFLAEKTT